MSTKSTSVLTSLRVLDQSRAQATKVVRKEGSNVDLFKPSSLISSEQNDDVEEIALCHMSAMLSFTFGDFVPYLFAFEDAAAVALAIQQLNVGDGSIIPEIAGLPDRCKVRFTVEFGDTQYSGGVTVKHVVQQVNRDPPNGIDVSERLPCAYIGAYRSAVSIPMSIVTGVFGIPQISGASTSVDLDDKEQYSLFGRTIPSDEGNAVPFIIYMRQTLNIQHLAVLNVNDSYGNAFAEGLRRAAEQYAPDMVIVQIPVDDSESSRKAAITALKESEFRFAFCLVFDIVTHDALLTEAYRQGVAGDGLHNWIMGDSFAGILDGRTFVKDSELHLAYRGVGLLEVSGGVPGIPLYEKFQSQLATLRNEQDLEYLGSLFPDHDVPVYDETNGSPPFINDPTFLSKATSATAPFFYEAAIALGLSACAASEEEESFSGPSHYEHFKNTEFTSFSGKVLFDPITGSRIPSSCMYKVSNWLDEEVQENGEIKIQFKPVTTHLYQNSNWTVLEPYIFNDGTTNLPLDLPPPVVPGDVYNLPLLIGAPIGAAVLLIVLIFLFYEHKRKQNDSVWHVKKEELKFPEPPHVIGQGSFGVVLLAEYRGTQVAVKRVIPPSTTKKQSTAPTATVVSTVSVSQDDASDDLGGDSAHSRSKMGNVSSVGTASGVGSSGYKSSMASGVGGGRGADSALRKRLKLEFIEEMRYLSKLRHPCVTTVMGAVIDRGEDPMLIMEYMEHGSLYDLLHNETMAIEGELLLPILRDISQGVRFLHAADPQVIHGDLKAQNILVDNRFRAKVADFGLSQKKNLGGTGTPFWMAPELLRGESVNTAATDVYSFGILLYEVYSRKDPYEGEDPMEVMRLVADPSMRKRPPVPRHAPSQIESLMKECLDEDPATRPTFEEVDIRVKRIDAETTHPSGSTKSANISLFDIFPRHIAEALQAGRTVEPEHRECVTIFFSDIVGFTDISSTLEPRKVANMLDRLYTVFDELSHKHDVFKVETIGDSYMCCSNLVKDQPDDHCKRIAQFAIEAIKGANDIQIDLDDPSRGFLNIRVGFHSGSVVADVVGTRNPRYCLFGDTVNTASRMESNSKVNRIHCSRASADLLRKQAPRISLQSRGIIPIKGKGKMKTYWVNETAPTLVKTMSISMLGEVQRMEQYVDSNGVPQEAPITSIKDRQSFMGNGNVVQESDDEDASSFLGVPQSSKSLLSPDDAM